MERFKIGDKAEVIGKGSHGFDIGSIVTIKSDRSVNGFYDCKNGSYSVTYWIEPHDLKLINQNNMDEFKITKERILAAAAKCSTAKATLETMFPEAFEKKPTTELIISPSGKSVRCKESGMILIDWSMGDGLGLRTDTHNFSIKDHKLIVTPKK